MNPLLQNTLRTFDSLSFGRNVCTSLVAKTKIDTSNSFLTNIKSRFGSYRSISQQVSGSNPISKQIVSMNQLGLDDVHIYNKYASFNQRLGIQKLETYQMRSFSSSNQSRDPEYNNKCIIEPGDRKHNPIENQSKNLNERKIDGGSALKTPIINPQTVLWVDSLSDAYGSDDDGNSGNSGESGDSYD